MTSPRKPRKRRPKSARIDPNGWFDTEETAGHVGASPKTLANMRSLGTGPCFHKIGGKVWYLGEDIIAYRERDRFIGSGVRHAK